MPAYYKGISGFYLAACSQLCKQHFRFVSRHEASTEMSKEIDFSYFSVDVLSSDSAEIEKVRILQSFRYSNYP